MGSLFLFVGAAVVGLPPLSGFLAKALLLQATASAPLPTTAAIWTALLLGGFFALIALTRAGITLFWAVRRDTPIRGRPSAAGALGSVGLVACLVALMVLAEPVKVYTDAIAAQLLDTGPYIDAVLRTPGR
jgi:multicomponent K+:H+ antiporter subunit D